MRCATSFVTQNKPESAFQLSALPAGRNVFLQRFSSETSERRASASFSALPLRRRSEHRCTQAFSSLDDQFDARGVAVAAALKSTELSFVSWPSGLRTML